MTFHVSKQILTIVQRALSFEIPCLFSPGCSGTTVICWWICLGWLFWCGRSLVCWVFLWLYHLFSSFVCHWSGAVFSGDILVCYFGGVALGNFLVFVIVLVLIIWFHPEMRIEVLFYHDHKIFPSGVIKMYTVPCVAFWWDFVHFNEMNSGFFTNIF